MSELRRRTEHKMALERARREFPQAQINVEEMWRERRWDSYWRRRFGSLAEDARIRGGVDNL